MSSVPTLKVGDPVHGTSVEGLPFEGYVIETWIGAEAGSAFRQLKLRVQTAGGPLELRANEADVSYDSRQDTLVHIAEVQRRMQLVIDDLGYRQADHDCSKLQSPEVEVFDAFAPKLRGVKYGSDEYKALIAEMKPGTDHHYAHNSHHPEYYRWFCAACCRSFSEFEAPERDWGNGEVHRFCPKCCAHGGVIWEAELLDRPERGIRGMNLSDIYEMLIDWDVKAKQTGGSIEESIRIGQQRYGFSDELAMILRNTLSVIHDVEKGT